MLIKAKNDFHDIADWWDLHAKPEIKKFAIGFSAYRLDKRNQTKNVLLHALKIMKEQNDWDEVVRIKGQLNEMLHEDLMGFKVRSKHKQDLEMERASLFHSARELKNFKA